MTIKIYDKVEQGTDEWFALRRGLLTASEMKLILTPTLKIAANEKERAHVYEILAQRITGFVEPSYVSDDMLRGREDEFYARQEYERHYAPVKEVGFVTNDHWGFTLGYSPDGLVGDDGQIETKSRRQKYQIETIVENAIEQTIPADYALQIQTGLLVTERKWCDFISYCGGAGMLTIRVFPDDKMQEAILTAAGAFEGRVAEKWSKYRLARDSDKVRLIPTERRITTDIRL